MHNIKGVAYAIISSATFGLIPLFSLPLLAGGVASSTILLYRMGLAAAIMCIVTLYSGKSFAIGRKDLSVIFLLSTMYAGSAFGLLLSYKYIPSGVATTINFLYPLVVAILMTLLFKEKNSIWIAASIVISLVGVGLLSWSDIGNDNASKGIVLALTTIFTYAIYIVGVMKSRVSHIDSSVLTTYVLAFGTLFFAIYALRTDGFVILTRPADWFNILMLATLPTVVSNLTLVLAIKSIGSTMTSILGSMEPMTAVLIGVIHFGEVFNTKSAAGLIFVIVAVIIVIMQARGEHQTNPSKPRGFRRIFHLHRAKQ